MSTDITRNNFPDYSNLSLEELQVIKAIIENLINEKNEKVDIATLPVPITYTSIQNKTNETFHNVVKDSSSFYRASIKFVKSTNIYENKEKVLFNLQEYLNRILEENQPSFELSQLKKIVDELFDTSETINKPEDTNNEELRPYGLWEGKVQISDDLDEYLNEDTLRPYGLWEGKVQISDDLDEYLNDITTNEETLRPFGAWEDEVTISDDLDDSLSEKST